MIISNFIDFEVKHSCLCLCPDFVSSVVPQEERSACSEGASAESRVQAE